jgi:DNA-binding response OmpR family regulator
MVRPALQFSRHAFQGCSRMHTVLVVEDDAAIRSALVDALTDEGYEAEGSTDGQCALAFLEHDSVDLLLVDIFMPTMSGSDMVRTLRRRGDETPIVMMSAQPARTLPHGVRFLRKPFDLDRLFEVIDEVLASEAIRQTQRRA